MKVGLDMNEKNRNLCCTKTYVVHIELGLTVNLTAPTQSYINLKISAGTGDGVNQFKGMTHLG